MVWADPRSLAATDGVSIDFLSSGYLDVSVPRVGSSREVTRLCAPGFPIRTSSDHRVLARSPRLFAGSYVLHRLLLPRHPPCALSSLFSPDSARYRRASLRLRSTHRLPYPYTQCERAWVARPLAWSSVPGIQAENRSNVIDVYLDVQSAEADSRTPKGGDPATGSPTATLLRLHPNRRPCRRRSPPCGWGHDFGHGQLSWCDGRCVQGPGTYSPRHAHPRLLAIPASWSRVADSNPN